MKDYIVTYEGREMPLVELWQRLNKRHLDRMRALNAGK